MRRLIARLIFAAAIVGTALVALGLVLHFTARDAVRALAPFFYALPMPLIAGLAAALAIYWAWRKFRVPAALLAVVSIGTLTWWMVHAWMWSPPTQARGVLRVVHWNVDRPDWRLEGIARWLNAQDADVITLAERYPHKKDFRARWQKAFPDYQLVISDEELLCLVRGEILSVEDGLLPHASYGTLLRTRIRGREVTVLQVDIQADPLIERRRPLRRLTEIVAALGGENLVIAGDFNTPLESVHLAALRAEATNAFEAVGRGCAATWPRVPLLSLDQIWSNQNLRPVRCELRASWRSDHRAVIAEFDFAR